MKKIITPVLLLSLMLSTISPVQNVESATKLSLSHTKCSMEVGESKKVKATKVVTWKTSNQKIVKVKKLSSKKAKITAKKAGSCIVTATAGKKKATIHVNVKKDGTTIEKTTVVPSIAPTTVPEQKATPVVQITNSPVPNGNVKTSPEATTTTLNSTEPTRGPLETTELPKKTATTKPTETPIEAPTTPTLSPTEAASARPTTVPTENPIKTPTIPTLPPTEAVSAKPTTVPTETPIKTPTIPTLLPTGVASTRPTIVPTETPIEAPTTPTLLPTGVASERPTTVPTETPIEETVEPSVTPIETPSVPTITPLVASQSGIVMTLNGYEKGRITYTIDNQSGKGWQYSYGYSIEKNIDGEWVAMEADREQIVPKVMLELKDGDVVKETTNIAESYNLEAGTYRYIKCFKAKDCKCMAEVSLTFEVDNNMTSSEGISMILDSYENGIVTYTIENMSWSEWIYDYAYSVEKKVDGEWVTMKTDRPVPIPKVQLELSKDSKVSEAVDLLREYDLEAGSYRFVKTFDIKSDLEFYDYTVTLALPFQVEKTIMNFSGVRATVEGFENGYLIYTIENLTDESVGYNPCYYFVKQEVNGEGSMIKNDFSSKEMPCVIETVEPGEKVCVKTYIGEWENLQSGKYVLSLYFYTDGIEFELPFEIK